MKKYILLVLITLCIPRITLSQVETHYHLKGYQFEDKSPMKIVDNKRNQVITKLPSFDKEKMLKEDLEMKGLDVPYRFGKGFDVMLSLENGQWADVEGGRLWSMTFESEDALSLNFIFTDFHLSDDAYLYITNEDKTVIYGPVRTKDTTKDGFFMTDLIKGSCATIYLFEPTSQEEMSTLIIKRVVHGYKEVFANMENGALGASADCNIGVACHPEYEKESNAVGMVLLSNGTEWCSGSLLMTTDYSFAPYFLTAFHCIDINSDGSLSNAEISNAQKWLFKFNYKLSTCGGSSLSPSYTYNSDTFMAGNHDTDFALVKLNNDLRANTNLTWVGWDHTGRTPVSGACLHHPVGDVMKVSLEDDPFSSSSWNGSIVNHWLVNFDHGIVQKGSSGSPLFDDSLRVVGQLHGGRLLMITVCKKPGCTESFICHGPVVVRTVPA